MPKLTLTAALIATALTVAAPALADDPGRRHFGEGRGDRHGEHFDGHRGPALRAGPRPFAPHFRPFRHRTFAFRQHRPILPIFSVHRIVRQHHPYGRIQYLTFDNGYYRAHVRGQRGNFFALILNPYSGAIVARFALR